MGTMNARSSVRTFFSRILSLNEKTSVSVYMQYMEEVRNNETTLTSYICRELDQIFQFSN
jgi:hypothetical protein